MRTRAGLVALVLVIVVVVVPATVEASTCAVAWGSLAKGAGDDGVNPGPPMFDVRAGRHDCYDRLVIDVHGIVADFHVGYVAGMTGLASGAPVSLRGGAFWRSSSARTSSIRRRSSPFHGPGTTSS